MAGARQLSYRVPVSTQHTQALSKDGQKQGVAAYIADLRERNAKLPALRDEMAKAKL